MDYAISLIGISYSFFNEKEHEPPSRDKDEAPFWIGSPGAHLLPTRDTLEKGGMCCVGMINLVRRYLNLSIPECYDNNNILCVGGTFAWFKYLKTQERLEKIDYNISYPQGTLLLQDYNSQDQGHVALVCDIYDTLSQSKIIHSQGVGEKKCVMIERLADSEKGFRYTHCCRDFFYID